MDMFTREPEDLTLCEVKLYGLSCDAIRVVPGRLVLADTYCLHAECYELNEAAQTPCAYNGRVPLISPEKYNGP